MSLYDDTDGRDEVVEGEKQAVPNGPVAVDELDVLDDVEERDEEERDEEERDRRERRPDDEERNHDDEERKHDETEEGSGGWLGVLVAVGVLALAVVKTGQDRSRQRFP